MLRLSLLNKGLLFCVMIGRNWESSYEFKCQFLYPNFLNLIVIFSVLYMYQFFLLHWYMWYMLSKFCLLICEIWVIMVALMDKDHCAAELMIVVCQCFGSLGTEDLVDGCSGSYFMFFCVNSLFSGSNIYKWTFLINYYFFAPLNSHTIFIHLTLDTKSASSIVQQWLHQLGFLSVLLLRVWYCYSALYVLWIYK